MLTIFRHTFTRFRGQIIGWGLALLLLGLYLISFFDTFMAQQEQFLQIAESFPPAMSAFFGDLSTMATPEGYLSVEYFSLMPLILGIFAVLGGSGLLASDEESGRLDLVLAHPVSRTALFAGRLLGFVAATLSILVIAWLGLAVPAGGTSINLGWGELLLPFLSLMAVLLLFGVLALLLSMVLPSRRLAAMTAGLLLVASYFVTSLARLDEGLEALAAFSPLRYYQSGEAIRGLNLAWLSALLAVALLLTLLAWWRFTRRDIRVGGEGSMSLRRVRPAVRGIQ
ncbi:MAG TPA: ABC transporter permease subunit [Ardenticatenaceae bacterium]|nr:ABC transporter permease subunit [Ardenticatenaceae bacterium]